jgi:hypothetical protein
MSHCCQAPDERARRIARPAWGNLQRHCHLGYPKSRFGAWEHSDNPSSLLLPLTGDLTTA